MKAWLMSRVRIRNPEKRIVILFSIIPFRTFLYLANSIPGNSFLFFIMIKIFATLKGYSHESFVWNIIIDAPSS
jgi:hypothetical protein